MKKMIFAMSLIAASVLSGSPTPPDGGTGMRLACQMWGVKDFWEKDPERGFAEVFPKLRAMGYEGVQSMAFWTIDPDRLEALLKANGLALADMPVSFDHIEGANVDKTVAFCRRFGVDFVYVPWFKGQTSAEWRDFCKRLSAAGRRLRPYGIRVGYHNHLHEFTEQLQNEFPADILKSDREVNLELDIGPVAESGRDAPTWIADLSGRVPGLHAKPYGASAIGAPGDVQNWPKVIDAARRAGVKWFVVECEQRKNTYDDVAASAAYLKGVWNAAPPPERKPRVVMNLVNFVRGCEPRRPMDLVTPVAEQIRCNRRYGMPSTILMQYDAMLRDDIMAAAATADRSNTEFGVWIEIVKPLCEAVGIAWRGRKDWAWDWWVCPGFLEAYTQEQRAKLIDELFRLFKEKFGATPKSVGSWVMDAWSIAYMKEKYGIVAVCVCREEDVTDAYGLRGGYSNGGYYPSRLNMLSAASDMANAVKVPVFKMLTPDPIYNYGFKFVYHDSRTGKERRHVVTLEPAGLGKEPYIVDWYFRAYTEPRGMLNLSYMQTGQENSFGWTEYGVNVGYNCQLEELKRYVDRGVVEVETLGDTGRRFLADHAENCAQTQVALDDWMGQGRRSVWYNCKNYRANLYQEGNRFYIRDIHKMCDGFAEDHISTASTNWNELLFTPPVVDAYLFRTNGAPGMLAFTGQATGMTPRATGPNELEVACAYADGTFTLVRFDEGGIMVFGMPLEIKMNDEWRRNHRFSPGRIDLVFKDFRYAVGYDGRLAQTPDGYRIEPENGRIRFDLSIKDGRPAVAADKAPVKIIFDTDMIGDYDDVGAMAVLHKLADAGECEILATVSSTHSNASAGTVELINRWYGRPDIPVGAVKGEGVGGGSEKHRSHIKYERLLAKYPGRWRHRNANDAPDANEVYRQVLAAQPDGSVTICTVGFLTNLKRLLQTPPDAHSPLDGRTLVKRKVKAWYAMGWKIPQGRECNIQNDPASARYVLENWPTPIVIDDFNFSQYIYAGRKVAALPDNGNPIRDIFAWCVPPVEKCPAAAEIIPTGKFKDNVKEGHNCFDQSCVLAAVRGVGSFFDVEKGRMTMVGDKGDNVWTPDPNGPHARMVDKWPRERIAALIDDLMAAPPANRVAAPR